MRRFAKPLYGLTPVPRVRILPSPPFSLDRRGNRLHSAENHLKTAQFCDSCRQTGLEKVSRSNSVGRLCGYFSGGHTGSPVSDSPLGECNAITNRSLGERDLTLAARRISQRPVSVHWR